MKEFKHESYFKLATMPLENLLQKLQVKESGRSTDEVEAIRQAYGDNQIHYVQTASNWKLFKESYLTPFNLILLVLSGITFYTDYISAPIGEKEVLSSFIIFLLVFLSGTMTFIQNLQSKKSIQSLESIVQVTSNIKRDGSFKEIPTEEIVLGDIVRVRAGDMIPADLRLLEATDLFVSQTALTGESYPVEKRPDLKSEEKGSATDLENLLLTGSEVISGAGLGVTIKTGADTLFGELAENLNQDPPKTNFDLSIERTSRLLVRFMLVMAVMVILINGLLKSNWEQAILFGISIAVGLTPEMLPMIVSTNLIKGAKDFSKEGAITRHLSAIQNFGAIDVMVTDKTGTLTQDSIALQEYLDYQGQESERVLRHGFLNAYYQTGLGNVMDQAIVKKGEEKLSQALFDYKKIDEIPYDHQRRMLSVVLEDEIGKRQMITKGALEEIVEVSTWLDLGEGDLIPMTDELKASILDQGHQLNKEGLRVLGLSHKTNPRPADAFSPEDEADMVFLGYLAFLDPPKESTKEALKGLMDHGVRVKVMTGDNAAVTQTIAQEVGLEASKTIEGSALEGLTDQELAQIAQDYDLFVKTTPGQKAKLVQVLRSSDHVVGFMGDGINDAAALREADVGISVDNAVDIAKEAADLILLEKDLRILEKGVRIGRRIFGNTMKYIKATISSNFGNVFSVLIASIFLPFLPMEPSQLLLLGLIYELSSMSIPWDQMDQDYLENPKRWETESIKDFMLYFGPTSSIFDILTFAYAYFVLAPALAGGHYASLGLEGQLIFIAAFQTAWFMVSLWTQTLVIYTLRTPYFPFVESRPSKIVLAVTLSGLAIGTLIPYTGFGQAMGLVVLPGQFFIYLIGVSLAYLILVQIMKKGYVKKHGQLL